ncbi:MAG: hypothetical protein A2583_14000 [Bdellovibrionales bacterium RIFOXYD1_FULL_53_11]|nr:MAG: hypothetical protein A2583_14000 [Bdellovibrionales bacterium RIFOXYD1_FULL_53_11]
MADTSHLSNITDSAENKTTELYEAVRHSKPLFASNAEAFQATSLQLEKLAKEHGLTIATLLEQAHTTQDSLPHHIVALGLERQIAFLRR